MTAFCLRSKERGDFTLAHVNLDCPDGELQIYKFKSLCQIILEQLFTTLRIFGGVWEFAPSVCILLRVLWGMSQ